MTRQKGQEAEAEKTSEEIGKENQMRSPEIPDKRETSDIPSLPSGSRKSKHPRSSTYLHTYNQQYQTADYFLFAFPKCELSKQSGWQNKTKRERTLVSVPGNKSNSLLFGKLWACIFN